MEAFVRLYDLISAQAPAIFVAAALLGAIAAVVTIGVFSLRCWRVEKRLIETGIGDVVARTQLYAMLIAEGGGASRRLRNRQYLLDAIERWTAQRYQRWTEFQIYLAVRYIEQLQRKTILKDDWVIEQLARTLRVALLAQPGDPDVGIGLAIINNGIASIFGMRPSHPAPALRFSDLESSWPPASPRVHESASDLAFARFDPYEIEETLSRKLVKGPVSRLHELLRAAEWQALQCGFVQCNCSNWLLTEMVVWILHEEQIGPAGLPTQMRQLRDAFVQLSPQLPSFLRDKPIQTVERPGTDEMRITFGRAELPVANDHEFACHLGIAMRFDDELWRASSIEFCVANAATTLIFRPAKEDQTKARSVRTLPLIRATSHIR